MENKLKRHFYGMGKNKRRVYDSQNWKNKDKLVDIHNIIFPYNDFSLSELKKQYVEDAYSIENKEKLDKIGLVKVILEYKINNSLASLTQERYYTEKREDSLRIIAGYFENHKKIPCKIIKTNEKYSGKIYTIEGIEKKIVPFDKENFFVYVPLSGKQGYFFSASSLATGQA